MFHCFLKRTVRTSKGGEVRCLSETCSQRGAVAMFSVTQILLGGFGILGILCPIKSVECGQFRHYVHENFENCKIISTPTDTWTPSARTNPTVRRGRNYLKFFKIFMNIGTELSNALDGTQYNIIEAGILFNID